MGRDLHGLGARAPLVHKVTSPECSPAVELYPAATRQTDIQREATDKEKTGVTLAAWP